MRQMPPKRPPFCYEPLWTSPSSVLDKPMPFVAPPDADPATVEALRREHEAGPKNPDWLIWGSAIWVEPKALAPADDSGLPHPGGGVVFRVRSINASNPLAPNSEGLAKRIAECVNAMAGIADPAAFVAGVRSLLDDHREWRDVDETAGKITRMLGC